MSQISLEMAAAYAKKHFELNTVATEGAIKAFEEQHQIMLPEEYRMFMLMVGNGGKQWERPFFPVGDFGEYQNALSLIAQPFPHTATWNQAEAKGYLKSEHIQGALPFFHEGDGMYHLLIVTGDERGRVWLDARASDGGIRPLPYEDDAPRLTFFDWFKWYDALLDSMG